jgi:hypothetical protein
MMRRPLLLGLLGLVPAVGLIWPAGDSSAQPPRLTKKHALLVGCSKYQANANFPDLEGPPNDVRILGELLSERCQFVPADIVRLAGWPDEPAQRPTYANIVKAVEDLIRKADSETQIVILLAGHGTQVPIPEGQDPLDKKNYEPDGLDEAFVPADAGPGGGPRGWHNLLLDDQIGQWLDAFRAKGAAVWILFDCCHSGSMDRSGADLPDANDEVRVREVNAVAAGLVTAKAWQKAVDRGADSVARARAKGQWPDQQFLPEMSMLGKLPVAKGKQGSVVAFYASQAFEKEVEHYGNAQLPRIPENKFGRLCWNLVQTVRQFQGKFKTYGELAQLLTARYAATYANGPTPYCDGDLQRAVLGTEVSKQLPITLKKGKDLRLTAGALQGLTVGSVLTVHSAIGSSASSVSEPLGYVEVVKVNPMNAEVRPTAFEGKPAVSADRLPDLGRCELKSRDFGDLKVRLALPVLESPAANQILDQIRKGLSKEALEMVQFVDSACNAEWILWVHENRVQLRQGEGRPLPETLLNTAPVSKMQRVFLVTKLQGQPMAEVVADVERDLQRVFTAHNLLRVASAVSYETTYEGVPALQFAVLEVSADGKAAMPLPEGSQLVPGQRIALDVFNNSPKDWWVVLCVLGSDYDIRVFPTVLKGGTAWNLKSATISGASWGKEAFVVFGGPLKIDGVPDFSFLTQEGLYPETEQRAHGSKEKRNTDKVATTPFGKLLARVATGKGAARSLPLSAPSNPVVRSWSGISLAPPDRARRLALGKKGRP